MFSKKYDRIRKLVQERVLKKEYKQISVKTSAMDRKSEAYKIQLQDSTNARSSFSYDFAAGATSRQGCISSNSRNTIVNSVQGLASSETISHAGQPPMCVTPAGFHQSLQLLEASVIEIQRPRFLPDLQLGHALSPHSLSRIPPRLWLPNS